MTYSQPPGTDGGPATQAAKERSYFPPTDWSAARTEGSNPRQQSRGEGRNLSFSTAHSAPPQPAPFSASAQRGQQLFGTGEGNPGVGCFLCHSPTMVTAPRHETEALQSLQANLYSDLLIHHMGSGLADNVTQGLAQGDMFRTTPLWGIGQRLFFLHDGRTNDLLAAIQAHASTRDEEDG